MGRDKKKVETKPPASTTSKPAEPEKKGKGHRQKGAGTIVVSKGEITNGGIVMKEWQRTPLQLIREYCQKQKRPNPQLLSARAPPGKFCTCVKLSDPKNKEKDLTFTTTESFDDDILAKNCSCLLALHHFQPTLPLHQKLPEPYSSMWLKISGMDDKSSKKIVEKVVFSCPFCEKTFEKEMGLKVHMGKDHKGQKLEVNDASPIADTQSKDASPTVDLSPSGSDVSPKVPSPIGSSPKPTPSSPKPIPSTTKPTPSTTKPTPSTTKPIPSTTKPIPSTTKPIPSIKPARPIADHRNDAALRDLSLETRNSFSSRYEQQMAIEKKRIKQVQAEKRREIEEQLRKPPTVLLSESNQQYIIDLLNQQGIQSSSNSSSNNTSQSKQQLVKELTKLGFPSEGITEAVKHCDTLSACLDWCCIHLPDNQLPAMFRASGKQLDLTTNRKIAGDAVIRFLVDCGFGFDDAVAVSKRESSLETCLFELTRRFLNWGDVNKNDSKDDWMNEIVDTELEALKAIFNIDDSFMIVSKVTEMGCSFIQYTTEVDGKQATLWIVLSSLFQYPRRPPVVFLHCGTIPDSIRLAFTKCVFHRYSTDCEGVLYDVLSDVDTFYKEAEKISSSIPQNIMKQTNTINSSPSSNPTPSTPSTPSTKHKSSKSPSSKPTSLHPSHRHINKQSLQESPSSIISHQRSSLPITAYKDKILHMIQHSQVSLLSGGTGCGKSTQVPQFILEDFKSNQEEDLNIVVCEPRRISCLGLYSRVLEEQGFTEGNHCPVGYQVRGDSKISSNTVITYCTTGVLLRQLQAGEMHGITHILVDEIHERSILSDFLLLLLKRILPSNPQLKVLLMSATLDQQLFCDYFGNVPTLSVEGRLFSVTEKYLEDVVFDTRYKPSELTQSLAESPTPIARTQLLTQWCERYQDYGLIVHLISYLFEMNQPWNGGVILVFLSGAAEIKTVSNLLQEEFESYPYQVDILPCHGSLSTTEQKRVFESCSLTTRRIVLSTNIAETSITIPDCTVVIDTGREKRVCFNPDSNITEMKEVWISHASAEQRKGRAGRVRSGTVYRLFTRPKLTAFESFTPPEMVRSPLDALCLQTLRMGLGNPLDVLTACITPPPAESILRALITLQEIQAVTCSKDHKGVEQYSLTSLGNHIADLPLDCRMAKMLIFGCLLHCVDAVVTMAAFLSQRTVFRAPMELRDDMKARKMGFAHRLSDHLTLLRVYDGWKAAVNRREFCRSNFINYESMLTVNSLRRQFLDELKMIHFLPAQYREGDPVWNCNGKEENVLKGAITAGLYGNVVKVEKKRIRFHKTIEGGTFESTPEAKEYRLLINREVENCEKYNGHTCVFIHPSSINFAEREYPFPFMLYTFVMNTSKLFVHDLTVVPPYSLLLFGGNIAIQHLEGTLTVDDWLYFTAPARVGVLIQQLRSYMDDLLEKKFKHPELLFSEDPVMKEVCNLLISNGLYHVCDM